MRSLRERRFSGLDRQLGSVEDDEAVAALAFAGAPPERDPGGAAVELELADRVVERSGRAELPAAPKRSRRRRAAEQREERAGMRAIR